MAEETYTIAAPGIADQSDGTPAEIYTLGREFESSAALPCIGVDWWTPTALPTIQNQGSLWQKADKGNVALSPLVTLVPGDLGHVYRFTFVTPFTLVIGVRYVVGVLTNRYVYTAGADQFPKTSVPNGYMTAPAGVNSRFDDTGGVPGTSIYPDNIHPSAVDYHIAPVLQLPGGGHPKGSEFLTFF